MSTSTLPANTVRNIFLHYSVGKPLPSWLHKPKKINEDKSSEDLSPISLPTCATLFQDCLFKSHKVLKQNKKAQRQKHLKARHQRNVHQRQEHQKMQQYQQRQARQARHQVKLSQTKQKRQQSNSNLQKLQTLSRETYAKRDRLFQQFGYYPPQCPGVRFDTDVRPLMRKKKVGEEIEHNQTQLLH
jgi:hypothetical protein